MEKRGAKRQEKRRGVRTHRALYCLGPLMVAPFTLRSKGCTGFDKRVVSPSKGSARTECEDFTGPDQ